MFNNDLIIKKTLITYNIRFCKRFFIVFAQDILFCKVVNMSITCLYFQHYIVENCD